MSVQTDSTFVRLLEFLDRLDDARLVYTLAHMRDSVMISVAVPGERWEIEFLADSEIEVERFISRGIEEASCELLDPLIAEHGGN